MEENFRIVRPRSRGGLCLHYLASEIIYHHEGAGSRKRGPDFAPLRQRAANFYFLRKHFGLLPAAGYTGAVLVGSSARLFAMALFSPLLVALGRFDRGELSRLFARSWKIGDLGRGTRRQAIGT